MADPDAFSMNVNEELDRFFEESSCNGDAVPVMILIMGPVAVGKTRLRKERYATGYVVVDAVEVFLNLSRGEYLPFPGPLEEPMNLIGALVADRALEERRNIVTEIIGADYDETKALIDAMTAIGYHVEFVYVSCDFEQAVKWNLERGDACVSAYYAEPFHRAWLLQAAAGIMNRGG